MSSERLPFVVVGAGAAGLLAAIHAGRGGVPTRLLETRPKPGAKIRVSGGGRCNVLPSVASIDDFRTEGSPNVVRNVLASWPLERCRAFFEEELGVPLKVEDTGKVFPVSDDPKEIVAALLGECERVGVELVGGARVTGLERIPGEGGGLELTIDGGEPLRADRVLLATGGLSLPKTGSDGGGLALAQALGHTLLPDYPALVPLFAEDAGWGELAGVSLPVRLTAWRGGKRVEEREGDFLFTHRGFSGPVVLDVSHHCTAKWAAGSELRARWIGRSRPEWEPLLLAGGKRTVAAILREELPRRLALRLLDLAALSGERRASELDKRSRRRLVALLDECPLGIVGDEGYRTAEVTGGGVPLAEVVTKTLESRLVPGLYFAGEILDVTGRIGGFNFLWAWVSGRKVGEAVAGAHSRAVS